MDIIVYSRPMIEIVEPQEVPHLIVSINCPGEEPSKARTNDKTLGRVNLFFWDLDAYPEGATQDSCPLVQHSDAASIVDLVEAHPTAERIVVHCTAGKSRSAGVAAALHLVLNGSDEPIFGNARYRPNMLVYRLVLNAWYDRHP